MAFAAVSGSARAQAYIGVRLGANFEPDNRIHGQGIDGHGSYEQPGWTTSGVLGYRFGLPANLALDAEGEFAYRHNNVDTFKASGFPNRDDGSTQSFMWMGNLWLSWLIPDTKFAPYIGGGAGGVHIDINDASIANVTFGKESVFVLGGQVGTGLEYRLTEHVALSLDYRFIFTEAATMQDLHVDYQVHSATFGIKYLF